MLGSLTAAHQKLQGLVAEHGVLQRALQESEAARQEAVRTVTAHEQEVQQLSVEAAGERTLRRSLEARLEITLRDKKAETQELARYKQEQLALQQELEKQAKAAATQQHERQISEMGALVDALADVVQVPVYVAPFPSRLPTNPCFCLLSCLVAPLFCFSSLHLFFSR